MVLISIITTLYKSHGDGYDNGDDGCYLAPVSSEEGEDGGYEDAAYEHAPAASVEDDGDDDDDDDDDDDGGYDYAPAA
uniref:Uncharacterized protein n=1 Tax=Nelumbo nucifera TaxID=4432 RepID=A0A822Y447_NELNU|nr:TPA_asm: hypothetical protein HUJ06_028520 [Nelumbo nucifera]